MIKALQTLRRIPFYHRQLQGILLGINDARHAITELQMEVARLRRTVYPSHCLPFEADRWEFKENALDRLAASVPYSESEE